MRKSETRYVAIGDEVMLGVERMEDPHNQGFGPSLRIMVAGSPWVRVTLGDEHIKALVAALEWAKP